MMQIFRITIRVCASLLLGVMPAGAATIAVAAGANLQQAINSASAGDTIALASGAIFTGSFTLPAISGDAITTIRTAADDGLPGDGARISPASSGALAIIRAGGSGAAIKTASGAHHWRLMLLEVQGTGGGDLISLGDGSATQTTLATVAHDLIVDRLYIHGDAERGQKRGIALNSASTTITGSYISDIKLVGQDSQAICGWNGPGPYSITNNYLEAAGENLMFGGSDPTVPNLVPADIVVADNYFTKPVSWRAEKWSAKNLIELKNARRVLISGNTLENNWEGGQPGFAIVFTVRNQNGRCAWCQVDHVTFERNVVRHIAAGIKILGWDNNHPSQQTQAILIRNNLFYDIDSKAWGGNGYFVAMTDGARDITVDHNTVIQAHALGIVQIDGPPVLGFVYTNNLSKYGSYGISGTGHGSGFSAIAAFLPGSEITRNVIAGAPSASYPAGNSFPSAAQFETQFMAFGDGDYRLIAGSPWRGAGSDGQDLGAPLGPTP
jgi:Right handed beta helix region